MIDRAVPHHFDGVPLPARPPFPPRLVREKGGHSGVRHGSDGELGPGHVQGGGPSHRRGKDGCPYWIALRVVVADGCGERALFCCRNTAACISSCWLSCVLPMYLDCRLITVCTQLYTFPVVK